MKGMIFHPHVSSVYWKSSVRLMDALLFIISILKNVHELKQFQAQGIFPIVHK